MEEAVDSLLIFVNGKRYDVPACDPEMTLLAWLRSEGWTGAKLGCGEGGCGACTVMISNVDVESGKVVHRSVNACLFPLCAADSCAVTTVEGAGLSASRKGLHPIQKRIAELHGSQCGACTPGIVMALYTFLRNHPKATAEDIEESLDGNLCRCTGYRPILDAAKSFASDRDAACAGPPVGCCGGAAAGSGGCCMSSAPPSTDELKARVAMESDRPASVDGLGRPVFRVVTSTADKVGSYPAGSLDWTDTEPIFPPFLKTRHEVKPLHIVGPRVNWYRPLTVDAMLKILAEHPDAVLVGGNTEVGIETKFKSVLHPHRIATTHIPSLAAITVLSPGSDASSDLPPGVVVPPEVQASGGIVVGGGATLAALASTCKSLVADARSPTSPASRVPSAIVTALRYFASRHIRSVATLAGNIATASPISDMNPLLVAAGAQLVVAAAGAPVRTLSLREFFLKYRTTALAPGDLILAVIIPFTTKFEFVGVYKQARRRDDDIALVGAAFKVALTPSDSSWVVSDAGMAYAGMAPITVQPTSAVEALVGKPWSKDTFSGVFDALHADMTLPATVPGGMAEFRMAVAASFAFKFFLQTTDQLSQVLAAADAGEASLPAAPVLDSDVDATIHPAHRPVSFGLQSYDVPMPPGVGAGDGAGAGSGSGAGASSSSGGASDTARLAPKEIASSTTPESGGAAGKPIAHLSAEQQVTGEALYTDDVAGPSGCLEAALITSAQPHATFEVGDMDPIRALPGVEAVLFAADVPGSNVFGIGGDEEVLATSEVRHVGQAIGIVVASTRTFAQRAAKAAEALITYSPLPTVLSIREAIAAKSFIPYTHKVVNGDVDAALAAPDVTVLKGNAYCNGQEHFYLEPNAVLCIPGEANRSMTITSSTQGASVTQATISGVTGLPQSRIVSKVKRIGGGFGGKESRSATFAAHTGMAAFVLQKPVRMCVERDYDMKVTGQRHGFYSEWTVGYKADGTIVAVDLDLYNNAGFSLDLSGAVMDRALWSVDGAYHIPASRFRGHLCKTNTGSNTAFRGFGSPQGMFMMECLMTQVAETLGVAPDVVRRQNLYSPGDLTPYGTNVGDIPLRRMWDEVSTSADVTARRAAVESFNAANRYVKRGLSIVPTKYGINFGLKWMNQGGCLVQVYVDGTVLITHGGVEMGQGLYVKMVQVASQMLGVPVDMVHCEETATDKVPNQMPTAASASTDIYGAALVKACAELNKRLEPYKEDGKPWADVVRTAHFDRVNLSAQGFYIAEKAGWDWDMDTTDNTKRGKGPFSYFTNGLCVAEVEVDCLTGDHTVHRVDILMDLGNSVNVAIDVGQVEGAFVQGQGWATIEELVWGDDDHPWVRPGNLFTAGPGTYKIPSFNDTPVDFRVSLLHNTPNPDAVFSSKAVGEPPLFLGTTCLFAIREAIKAARPSGSAGDLPLHLPATADRIRMGCCDEFTERVAIKPSSE